MSRKDRKAKQERGLIRYWVLRTLAKFPDIPSPEDVWAEIADKVRWEDDTPEEARNVARDILRKYGAIPEAWVIEPVKTIKAQLEQEERATEAAVSGFLEKWEETKREQFFMLEDLAKLETQDPEAAKRIREQLDKEIMELELAREEVAALEEKGRRLAQVSIELDKAEKEMEELLEARRRLREVAEIPGMEVMLTEAAERASKPMIEKMEETTRKFGEAFKELREDVMEEVRAAREIIPEVPGLREIRETVRKTVKDEMDKATVSARVEVAIPARDLTFKPDVCLIHWRQKIREEEERLGRRLTASEKEILRQEMLAQGEGLILRDTWLEEQLRSKLQTIKVTQVWNLFPQGKLWWAICPDHRAEMYPTYPPPINTLEGYVGKLLFDRIVTRKIFTEEGIPEEWIAGALSTYASYRAGLSEEERADLDEFWPANR